MHRQCRSPAFSRCRVHRTLEDSSNANRLPENVCVRSSTCLRESALWEARRGDLAGVRTAPLSEAFASRNGPATWKNQCARLTRLGGFRIKNRLNPRRSGVLRGLIYWPQRYWLSSNARSRSLEANISSTRTLICCAFIDVPRATPSCRAMLEKKLRSSLDEGTSTTLTNPQ